MGIFAIGPREGGMAQNSFARYDKLPHGLRDGADGPVNPLCRRPSRAGQSAPEIRLRAGAGPCPYESRTMMGCCWRSTRDMRSSSSPRRTAARRLFTPSLA